MTRIIQWYRLAYAMGLRYVLFRLSYELKRKGGLLKGLFPTQPAFQRWITLERWRQEAAPFFFQSRKHIDPLSPDTSLIVKAKRILAGEVQFFQGEWKKIDMNDWLSNPATGYRYDGSRHWTEIPDFHPAYGDIKYVWERSRFSFLTTIMRYDAPTGADTSEWVFSQIESWIKNNPINQGPNYRCSQETSLRVMNWIFALYYYRDSANLTNDRFENILFHIYWQLRHIRSNIHFSRIAVRNNHAITETLALYSAGLLFPFFEEAPEWRLSGKKWFEEEIAYQVYPDGGYLQFSFNYQRVVIQLLTYALALAHRHKETFRPEVYQRAYASLNLLLHSQDPVSGQLPNYGANDGSLFFCWNDEPFRNYRPALDALHFLLTSSSIYPARFEDRLWWGIGEGMNRFEPISVKDGVFSFPTGGIFGYRSPKLLVWTNCVTYHDRPLQADALHLDVWYEGNNLLRDAGSYRYNTSPAMVNYFSGTESHNTVMVDGSDQMLKGPRFIWLNWTQARSATWEEQDNERIFRGEVDVYRHLGRIRHCREIRVNPVKRVIVVKDEVKGAEGKTLRQLWHIDPAMRNRIQFVSLEDNPQRIEEKKYYSPTYGVLEDALQIEFQPANTSITTEIRLV